MRAINSVAYIFREKIGQWKFGAKFVKMIISTIQDDRVMIIPLVVLTARFVFN